MQTPTSRLSSKRGHRSAALLLAMVLAASGSCTSAQLHGALGGKAAVTSLTVALYPWVPRPEQFQTTLKNAWASLHPDISLVFVPADQWDGGYDNDPNPNWDVYVFDAINLDYFRNNGWLLALTPSQVQNSADLLAYARNGVQLNGSYYGIPQLGCGDILFYNASDAALASATTMTAVTKALGFCQYYGTQPPSGVGMMLDLSGGTTNATTYVETLHERLNQFPVPLPKTPAELDSATLSLVRSGIGTASFYDVYYTSNNAYIRADWYNKGLGRGYIGFTESMSQISATKLSSIAFKPMPWSDNATGNGNPLFYSDVVGIVPQTSVRGTMSLAIELANLMSSTDVVSASIGPWQTLPPQYLLPVRTSVFDALETKYPTYAQLQKMVNSYSPILFNLGPESKPWVKAMKHSIVSAFQASPVCYCDLSAGPIADQSQANSVCPNVCAGTKGWNGQWTTVSPGNSVCGCGCGVHASQKEVAAKNPSL